MIWFSMRNQIIHLSANPIPKSMGLRYCCSFCHIEWFSSSLENWQMRCRSLRKCKCYLGGYNYINALGDRWLIRSSIWQLLFSFLGWEYYWIVGILSHSSGDQVPICPIIHSWMTLSSDIENSLKIIIRRRWEHEPRFKIKSIRRVLN